MKIYELIQELLNYSLDKNLIDKCEEVYSRNLILDCFNLDEWKNVEIKNYRDIETLLNEMCQWAVENNLIPDSQSQRELFDTRVMNCVTPRPKEVINKFYRDFEKSPELATKNYYEFSQNTNYIRAKRIEKNLHWFSESDYGDLEITINLAKPEKDPKDIAREKNAPKASYPSCLLCSENMGYRGRINHPARQTHRIIPLEMNNEFWYLQFSPYVYYNEHSILFSAEHRPMKVEKATFIKLLKFIEICPHYFIGSNADLPIVGGSILSHDHYQAGNHSFPMAKAPIEKTFTIKGFENIEAGIVKWPMSVLRLTGDSQKEIIELSNYILEKWRNYSDESVDILAFSGDTPHNTITPIARRVGNKYQMDLALRNNRTSDEFPLGIFHPHNEVHNIKKENIGLIEVMGLAILPGRLEKEMLILEKMLQNDNWEEAISNDPELSKHLNWTKTFINNYSEITFEVLKKEIGKTFATVLEHAGVFKRDEKGQLAFERFINTL